MKKMMTATMVASAALALAACEAPEAEAPAEPAVTEEMAPETDPADAAADDLDPTSNPIGMNAPATEPMAAEGDAPAAE